MDYSQYKQIEFRRKFWKLFGAEISMFAGDTTTLIGFIKLKAMRLRDDVRLYTDRSMQQEVIGIHARNIVRITGATFDVLDGQTQQPMFTLHRNGIKSAFVRDHWLILDTAGAQYGEVLETSGTLAIARRWLEIIPYVGDYIGLVFAFVPETYSIFYTAGGAQTLAGSIIHRKNPYVVKMGLDTSVAQVALDPRICIAVTAMLAIVDAAKNN